MASQNTSLAALRAAENDYPLQREVVRITRDLNPTSVLTRRRHELWQRGIVDHFSAAYKAPDGAIKFRSIAEIANAGSAHPSGRSRRRLAPVVARPDDDHEEGGSSEADVNPTQVRLRDQQTRRVGREARVHLRKSLLQSERRLKLCKNGVMDPYAPEHVALWDGSNLRRSLSALAGPSHSSSKKQQRAIQDSSTATTLLIEDSAESPNARHPTSQTPMPRASMPLSTLGAQLPPIDRAGSGPSSSSPLLPRLRPTGSRPTADAPPSDDEGGAGMQPSTSLDGAATSAEAEVEEVPMGSFFFTQPSFRVAMGEYTVPVAGDEPASHGRQDATRKRSQSQADVAAVLERRRGTSIAQPEVSLPPLQPVGGRSTLAEPHQHSSLSQPKPSPARNVGHSPATTTVTDAAAAELHASAAEALRLGKRFKPVPVQQVLSRDYRAPSPLHDNASQAMGLSSKLRSHPQFQLGLYERGDRFHREARDGLARKQQEQRPKYDKKYRALDVGGAPLPFHATPAAILHHVEAVILRDERASSRADKHSRQLAELRDVATHLSTATRHPKVAEMLAVTETLFGLDRPEPGAEHLFGRTFAVLDDSDFLFHDVLASCVHIATLYGGVTEAAVIDHARTRAARFIHDQPERLLRTMEQIDRAQEQQLLQNASASVAFGPATTGAHATTSTRQATFASHGRSASVYRGNVD